MKTVSLTLAAALAVLVSAPALAQDKAHGKQVFDLWCSGCHKRLGNYVSSVAGTVVLQRKYQNSKPAALEDRDDLTPDLVKFYVRSGVKFMPSFRRTEINDGDLADLSAYLSK